jgi:hypothetical protein
MNGAQDDASERAPKTPEAQRETIRPPEMPELLNERELRKLIAEEDKGLRAETADFERFTEKLLDDADADLDVAETTLAETRQATDAALEANAAEMQTVIDETRRAAEEAVATEKAGDEGTRVLAETRATEVVQDDSTPVLERKPEGIRLEVDTGDLETPVLSKREPANEHPPESEKKRNLRESIRKMMKGLEEQYDVMTEGQRNDPAKVRQVLQEYGKFDDPEFRKMITEANEEDRAGMNRAMGAELMDAAEVLGPDVKMAMVVGFAIDVPEMGRGALERANFSKRQNREFLRQLAEQAGDQALEAFPELVAESSGPDVTQIDESDTPYQEAQKRFHDQREPAEREKDRERGLVLVERSREVNAVMTAALERAYPERAEIERQRALVEQELQGDIVRIADIPGKAVNKPMRIKVEGGREAAFKPTGREEQARLGIRAGESAGREWLAFQIDRALKLDIVPHTTLRDEAEHGVGSVQEWRSGKPAARLAPYAEKADPVQLESLALLDVLMQNTDRHANNFLIDEANGGKVWAIDNSLVLSTEHRGFDKLRSSPLRFADLANKPVSAENQARIAALRAAPEVLAALQQAFEVSLGDNAAKLWKEFSARLDQYGQPGAKLPESEL